MSLSKWANIHPYLSTRVKFLLGIADRFGGKHTITSGYRSARAQSKLLCDPRAINPVQPGCSQHQYGLAMDVAFSDPRWQDWFGRSASNIGLVRVSGDPVHVQALPGGTFKPVVERAGLCPDPLYKLATCGVLTAEDRCHARGGSFMCGRFGCKCENVESFRFF